MENTVVSKVDYSSLSVSALLSLYLDFNASSFYDKKKEVFNALIKKYFEDKTCVNIYDYLTMMRFKLDDNSAFVLYVINKEFETGVDQPMPEEYKQEFFRVLTSLLITLTNMSKNDNFKFEFHPSEIKTLVNYLKGLNTLDIDHFGLRQHINSLIKEITEDAALKNIVEKNGDTGSSEIACVDNKNLVTKEDIEEIKPLRLLRSKLNKTTLYQSLAVFDSYDEEDKNYLVSYMIKHRWESEARYIDAVTAFDFFKKHPSYSTGHKDNSGYFNPFCILSKSLTKSFMDSKLDYMDSWFKYFGVDNFNDFMDAVKNWYMSYIGATEKGWKLYSNTFFIPFFESRQSRLNGYAGDRGFYRYAQSVLYKDFKEDMEFFKQYKGVSILKLFEDKVCKVVDKLVNMPYFYGEGIYENLGDKSYECLVAIHFRNIMFKYNMKFFEYYGRNIEAEDIEWSDCMTSEDTKLVKEFLSIPPSLKINPEDFKTLDEMIKGHSPFNSDIKGIASQLIIWYFCKNKLDKEWVKQICFNKDIYESFANLLVFNGGGLFSSIEDFSVVFFDKIKDDLDFTNIEDLKVAFNLRGLLYNRGKLFTAFFEKFKRECLDCYKIILDFTSGNIRGYESSVIDFICKYYDL